MRPWIRWFMAFAAAGCSAPTPPPSTTPAAKTVASVLRGRIVVSSAGAMTLVTLQRPEHPPLGLSGEPAGEMQRLSGATVEVEGTITRGPPGDALVLSRYRILEINGEEPFVGMLLRRGDTLLLARAQDTVALRAAPGTLDPWEGAKLWITGPLAEGMVSVQSFGVLRPLGR